MALSVSLTDTPSASLSVRLATRSASIERIRSSLAALRIASITISISISIPSTTEEKRLIKAERWSLRALLLVLIGRAGSEKFSAVRRTPHKSACARPRVQQMHPQSARASGIVQGRVPTLAVVDPLSIRRRSERGGVRGGVSSPWTLHATLELPYFLPEIRFLDQQPRVMCGAAA